MPSCRADHTKVLPTRRQYLTQPIKVERKKRDPAAVSNSFKQPLHIFSPDIHIDTDLLIKRIRFFQEIAKTAKPL